MAKRLVIFDFDGTLVDTRRLVVATMGDVLAQRGLPVPSDDERMATMGMPLRECYHRLAPQLTDVQLDECYDAHQEYFNRNINTIPPELFPEMRETLDLMHSKGMLMSVATSRSTHSLHDLVARLHMDHYFSLLVGADDVEHHKPHPEAVTTTLERLAVPATEAMVVGDTVLDIAMGRAAGVDTCAVTYGVGKRDDLKAAGTDYIIDTPAQLLDLLTL